MSKLRLFLLGPFHATLDRQAAIDFEYDKVRALLAYLAVEADRPHSRQALAGLLWPDQPERMSRNNLRQALSKLRQAIGDQAATPPFLQISHDTVQFNRASDHWLDVTTFVTALAACEKHTHRRAQTCKSCVQYKAQAVELYRGDFLDQFSLKDSTIFEEWALLQRERLRQQIIEALADLAEFHELRGTLEAALRYDRRQLQLDPWREEAHRQVIRLLALKGQHSAALAQYEACRRILAKELGVEPTEETIALYEWLRSGGTLTPPPIPSSNLPLPPTPLVGREEETAKLVGLLEDPSCRLVTLVGPGGIGKTRLALNVATEMLTAFAEGVCFVPLAPLSSPEFLLPAIASALHCSLSGPEDPKAQFLKYLREHEMLLVLDGFEHLLQGADLLAEIIRSTPRVSLLVTSQERLSLQAEWIFEVQGLNYPQTESRGSIEEYSAMALFLQRAKMARTDFVLSQGEMLPIARICQIVEGMPLGIELAAAGVSNLTCQEISVELEHSLDSLAVTLRDIPERHLSIQAAFEYSWNRLSEEERAIFRALSVFRGGFEIEAAQEVAGAAPAVLAALVNKSLVRMNQSGRCDLHELLRQCASVKLDTASSEGPVIRQRHAKFFVKLAEAALPRLYGPGQAEWLDRLETEHDNLRAVLAWSLECGKRGEIKGAPPSDLGLQLAGSLWRYWETRGHLAEGRRWLESLLADQSDRTEVQAKALNAAGNIVFDQGDYPLARAYFEEALSIWEEMGDHQGTAGCLNNLGNVALYQGGYAAARVRYEKCLAIRRELGDRKGSAKPLYNLGITTRRMGDFQAARAYFRLCQEIYEELGDKRGCAGAIVGLGGVAGNLGDHAAARAYYEISLEIYRQMDDKRGVAMCLHNLAQAAFRMNERDLARDLLEQALKARHKLGDKRGISECLEEVAEQSAKDYPLRAARLLAAAQNLRETIGAPLPPVDHAEYQELLRTIRSEADESSLAAAWSEGLAMTLEQAIEYALLPEETHPPF